MTQSTALNETAERCFHIGDRENEIYEFFLRAAAEGTSLPDRASVDRFAGEGSHTINTEMAEVSVQGLHRIMVLIGAGKLGEALVELP